jgi:hypothetical protein
MKTGVDKCWGIRIGNPRRHWPYLMVEDGRMVPRLFEEKSAAEAACPKEHAKVVRVLVKVVR